MHRSSKSVAVIVSVLLGISSAARADEQGTPQPPASPTSGERPTTTPTDAPEKRFVIGANPLSILIGRYSVQGEYLLARHHAVTLNPVVTYTPVTVTVGGKESDAGSLLGFGGEVGYRFYSSRTKPEGFFVGPSFLFASYTQSAPTGSGGSASDSFLSYGGAVDLGGQAIVGPGIVFSGGLGLQYTATNKDIELGT